MMMVSKHSYLQKPIICRRIKTTFRKTQENGKSLSRDLNTGPADYKSAALPTKPLRRHTILSLDGKKDGARNG
jgi:hypothetical protein